MQASHQSFFCVLWTQTVTRLACRKRILKNAVKALDIFEKLKNRGKTRKDTEKSFVGSYSNTYAKLVQASNQSFYCVLWTQTVSRLACRKRILKNAVKALDIFEKLKNRGKTRKDTEKSFVGSYSNTYAKLVQASHQSFFAFYGHKLLLGLLVENAGHYFEKRCQSIGFIRETEESMKR